MMFPTRPRSTPGTEGLKPTRSYIRRATRLTKAAHQQKDRLKKLFGGQKRPEDTDDNTDSDMHGRDRRSKRNLDFLA